MKNINNRGFVMVETIIVAVFVIGICTFLFANFLPLIGDYERVSDYDSLNSKYKIHEIRKMLLRDINNNRVLANIFSDLPNDKGYNIYSMEQKEIAGDTITSHQLCDKLDSINYCNNLLGENYLGVKDIIITKFKLSKIKAAIKDVNGKRNLKDYIDYLPSYSKYGSRYNNYYRLIVSFNDGSIANIEVQYEIG
jgi:hypothetical protein